MINYKTELEAQLKELIALEKKISSRIKDYKGVEKGNIRVCMCHGSAQYHFKKEGEDKESYIPKYEISKIQKLVQRDYDEKVHRELLDMINRLDKFNKKYDIGKLFALYDNLPIGRKKLINPIVPTVEMTVEEWLRLHPGNRNTYENKHEFLTMKGEAVRSKSEKMIADYFFSKQIPYTYEPEVLLMDGRTVCPDFVALNTRKNKTVYWEHLGLVDKDDYATTNFNKLLDYEEVGLVLGDSLVITMETHERPLDMKIVKKKVKDFLL